MPLELLGHIGRTLSLSLRLFGNMIAGTVIVAVLLIGVEDTQVDGAVQIVTTSCRPHAELEPSKTGLTMRRALVFILSVESCIGV